MAGFTSIRTGSRRGLGKKLLWRLLKFLGAARATEVVALFAVIYFRFGLFGVNIHATNRIAFHVSHLASFSLVGAGLARPSAPFTANVCKPTPAVRRTSPPLPLVCHC